MNFAELSVDLLRDLEETLAGSRKAMSVDDQSYLDGLISDLTGNLQRIREHNLPEESFKWYLDLRKYGTVPHGGFGMGIERAVAWICGLEHVRETIPFARTLHRLYP